MAIKHMSAPRFAQDERRLAYSLLLLALICGGGHRLLFGSAEDGEPEDVSDD